MIVNCAKCGKTVKVSPCRKKPHNFCSRACFAQYVGGKPRTCPVCGKEFYVEQSSSQKYCSRACFVKVRFGHDPLSQEERKIADCYIKEAKAMMDGKHWEGKNLCVKLPGDEGYVPSQQKSFQKTLDLSKTKNHLPKIKQTKVTRQKDVLKSVVDSWQSIKESHPDGEYVWSKELIDTLNEAEEFLETKGKKDRTTETTKERIQIIDHYRDNNIPKAINLDD